MPTDSPPTTCMIQYIISSWHKVHMARLLNRLDSKVNHITLSMAFKNFITSPAKFFTLCGLKYKNLRPHYSVHRSMNNLIRHSVFLLYIILARSRNSILYYNDYALIHFISWNKNYLDQCTNVVCCNSAANSPDDSLCNQG